MHPGTIFVVAGVCWAVVGFGLVIIFIVLVFIASTSIRLLSIVLSAATSTTPN
jgi:hypothetical protein